jgi:tRNA G46 methylase TrmB
MSDIQEKLKIEKKIRKGRVGDWFKNILTPSLESNNNSCINFEIGCGHGHWLTSYAQVNPSLNFVGIDLITKRIEKATSKVTKEGLCSCPFWISLPKRPNLAGNFIL